MKTKYIAALSLLTLAACQSSSLLPADTQNLAGSSWQLVTFQGGDGVVLTPDDRAKYTIAFNADGGTVVRIDCNRGRGLWKSEQKSQLELGPLALTRAMCPPNSLSDQIVKNWSYIRSYIIKNEHLFLSLQADGGVYEFETMPKFERQLMADSSPITLYD